MRERQAKYVLPPDQEAQFRAWNAEGKTLTWCAEQFDLSLAHASRIGKRLGLLWSGNNPGMQAMADRERQKVATLRTALSAALLADAIALRERIWETYDVVAVTREGLDTIELELPDAKAVADFTKAVDSLVKSHTNLSVLGEAQGRDIVASMLGQLFEKLKENTDPEADDDV
jgi:hypothetical protein